MTKNIMLTIFTLCVILTFVGCKNGYNSIKDKSDKDAEKSQQINKSLVEKNTSSRRKNRICRSFRRNF